LERNGEAITGTCERRVRKFVCRANKKGKNHEQPQDNCYLPKLTLQMVQAQAKKLNNKFNISRRVRARLDSESPALCPTTLIPILASLLLLRQQSRVPATSKDWVRTLFVPVTAAASSGSDRAS
jgi:hypothetical protein